MGRTVLAQVLRDIVSDCLGAMLEALDPETLREQVVFRRLRHHRGSC